MFKYYIATLLFLCCSVFAQNATTNTQSKASGFIVLQQNIYAQPNVESEVIATIENGDKVDVKTRSNGWASISFGNINGWVEESLIKDKAVRNKSWDSLYREVLYMRREFDKMKKQNQKVDPLKERIRDLIAKNNELVSVNEEMQENYEFSLRIEQQNNELQMRNDKLTTEINILEQKMQEVANDKTSTYYFHGAIILFCGMVLAWISPRLMPKRRTDNWE